MPTLAKKIVDENLLATQANETDKILNFKGLIVGNPYTNLYSGYDAMVETFWNRQLIAQPTWNSWKESCRGDSWNSVCDRLYYQIEDQYGDMNYYAMDYPICLGFDGLVRSTRVPLEISAQRQQLLLFLSRRRGKRHQINLVKPLLEGAYSGYEPCGEMVILHK